MPVVVGDLVVIVRAAEAAGDEDGAVDCGFEAVMWVC